MHGQTQIVGVIVAGDYVAAELRIEHAEFLDGYVEHIADLLECYEEAKADAKESGKVFEQVRFSFKYDLVSFFDYFSFLNVSEIAKKAGINPSLMRQYT